MLYEMLMGDYSHSAYLALSLHQANERKPRAHIPQTRTLATNHHKHRVTGTGQTTENPIIYGASEMMMNGLVLRVEWIMAEFDWSDVFRPTECLWLTENVCGRWSRQPTTVRLIRQ